MSWDIYIMKFDRNYSTIEEIEDDAQPLSMGSRSEIQVKISELFPETDWSDPGWGVLECSYGTIDFSISREELVESFTLFVHSASDFGMQKIVELALKNGWQAMDTGSGGFLEKSEDPAEHYGKWEDYKDQVCSRQE